MLLHSIMLHTLRSQILIMLYVSAQSFLHLSPELFKFLVLFRLLIICITDIFSYILPNTSPNIYFFTTLKLQEARATFHSSSKFHNTNKALNIVNQHSPTEHSVMIEVFVLCPNIVSHLLLWLLST